MQNEGVPTIRPVTNLQKQWQVLTFHEDRLNRLDEYFKMHGEQSLHTDTSVLNNEIKQLSIMQETLGETQDNFIKTQQEFISENQRRNQSEIEGIQKQCSDTNSTLTSSIAELTERLNSLEETINAIRNSASNSTSDKE
tara:strand:- start:1587 stop:2003 length:417 start_codon:yes stop_codon:yes gene_type:complete